MRVTTARQPRRTPSSAANGISSALAPENPTTSQEIALSVSTTTRAPTDISWIGPATSTTRPRTPIARPSGRLTPVFASYGRALPRLRLHLGYKKILHGRRALHARIFFIATAPSWQKQRTRIDSVAVIARWFLTSCLPASLIIASPLWDFRGPSPDWTVGQSLLNRLRPNLNVEHEMTLGKKTNSVQYLRAIRLSLPRGRARVGSGFVNHALLRFRLGLSQSVLEGRRCGVPTCARSGEEGDWHARIAD
jgi:hypothetical protein